MNNYLKYFDRLNRINNLLRNQSTGTPEEFAAKIGVGRRQLYNILDDLKIIGAPIRYCRQRTTFIYDHDFDLKVSLSIKILEQGEMKNIFGGFANNFIPCNDFTLLKNNLTISLSDINCITNFKI